MATVMIRAGRHRILVLSFGITFLLFSAGLATLLLAGVSANAASCNWAGSQTGTQQWNLASNWSCGVVPGASAGDTVTITTTSGSGPYTIQVSSAIANAVTLLLECQNSSGCTIDIPGTGSLGLTGSSTVNSSFAPNTISVNGGTLSNTGTLNFVTGARLTLNSGIFDNQNSVAFATSSSGPSTFNWTGGTVESSVASNGTISLTSGSSQVGTMNITGATGAMTLSNQTISNGGVINYSSPTNSLTFQNSANISINGGASMTISNAAPIANGGSGTIDVLAGGTLASSFGGTATITVPVSNFGTVNVSANPTPGTLNLAGGGSHTGAFGTAISGDTLNFAGGTHTWNAGTTFPAGTNLGTIGITGGTTTANTNITIPSLSVSGGQLTVASPNTLTTTSLVQSGGILSGPGNVSTTNLTWNGGTQNGGGTTAVAGGTFSSGTGLVLSGSRVLDLNTAAVYSATSLASTNLSGDGTGVLQLEAGASLAGNGPAASTDAMQVLLRTPTAGGTVNLTTSNLQLNAGADFGNTVTIGGGTSLIVTSGAVTTKFNSGSSVPGAGTLAVSGGDLTTIANITPANVTFSAGLIHGLGIFQPTNLSWSGGTLGVSGDGGQVVIPGGGTVAFSPAASAAIDHPFINGGTFTWTGTGTLALDSSTTFSNSGTFDAQGNGVITCGIGCGSSAFNNNSGATFKKSGGGGTTIVSNAVTFNNSSGTVNVASGTLQIAGGGSSGGGVPLSTFTTSPGATIDFNSGAYAFGVNTTFTGSGTASFSGAAINLGSLIAPTNAILSAGSISGGSTFAPTNFTWSGGTIGSPGDGVASLNTNGTVTMNPGVSTTLDTRAWNNSGTVNWAGNGTFYLDNNASVNNSSTGIFTALGNGAITCTGTCTSSAFLNGGTFQKTTGAGTTTVAGVVGFNNSGSGVVSGQSGILQFNGKFTASSGTVTAVSPGTIEFANGTNSFAAASNAGGSGTFSFSGGGTTIAGGYSSTGTTSVSGGIVTFTATGDVGALQLGAGTINGTGGINITNGGTATAGAITTTGTTTLAGGTFNATASAGPITISSALVINSGATFNYTSPFNNLAINAVTNNGSFVVNASGNITQTGGGAPVFTNNASFTRSGGSNSSVAIPFLNSGGSALFQAATTTFSGGYTQNSGTTQLFGGSISSPSTVAINGGTLAGVGTIGANLVNAGSISVGTSPVNTGVLSVAGTYSQSATGALNLKIQGPAAGTQYDQFNTSGAVSLNGALAVTGGYAPTATDSFTIMSFASKSGDFSSKSFPSGAYRASYLPTAAPTTLVLAAPSFDLSATQSGPSSVVNGSNAAVTITVKNTGPSAVDATLNGTFSGPASFGAAPTATGGGTCSIVTTTSYTCTWPSIGATSNTVTLTLATSATGTISTTAAVSSSLSPDSTPSNDTAPALSISVTPSVDLGIAITGSPNPVTSGGTETYTVTVTNNGIDTSTSGDPVNFTLTNGTITSTSGAFTCGAPAGTTVSCTMPPILGSGGFITETVTTTAGTGASLTLSGTVSDANDTNSSNDTASAVIGINTSADIAVTQSGPASVIQGQNATIVVTVTNNGPSPATNVTTIDSPTNGGVVAVTSSQGTCSGSPGWNCNLGTLASGASATATYTVNAPGPSPLTNNASANATESDPVPSNNTATPLTIVVVSSADIAISQTAAAPSINAGQNAVFTIVVTNNGPLATSVNVNGTISGGTFVSAVPSGTGATCSTTGPSCVIVSLANGASQTITLTVNGNTAGTITSAVTATGSASDPNSANNSATTSVAVVPAADLAVTSTASPNPVGAGQNTTITVTVKNLGPSTATNVALTDSFTGATFISSSASQGSCTAGNCSLGTLTSGSTATVTIVLRAGTGGSIQNTASVSATEGDANSGNNSSTLTVSSSGSDDVSVTKSGPSSTTPGATVTYAITVSNAGPSPAAGIAVTDPTPTGLTLVSVTGACSALPCTISSLAVGASATINATYTVTSGPNAPSSVTNNVFVSSKGDPNNQNNTASVTTVIACATQPPSLISPNGTAIVSSPVTFTWTPVTNANSYEVFVTQGSTTRSLGTTTATTITGTVSTGPFSWYVVATTPDCGALTSNSITVNACNRPDAPIVSVVANAASTQPYSVLWDRVTGAGTYEIQEATNSGFTDATTQTVTSGPVPFAHTATSSAQPFFYRVRAIATCDPNQKSPYSTVVRVVISPVNLLSRNPNANVPAGSTKPVPQEVHIPGIDDGNSYSFSATVDKPWLTVAPASGVLPPLGINLQVTADPSTLSDGTFTGTVIVSITQATTSSSGVRTNGNTTVSLPISVSLVTPVTPTNPVATPANAFIIPSVGHLDGLNSQWQSDVRVANTGFSKQQILLTFTPTTNDTNVVTSGVKQTTITVDAGQTVALDDVAHNWFGVGSLGEAANGVLMAQPLSSAAAKDTTTQPSVTTVVASSRTYNVSSTGTLGQYIPAIPFSAFIGAAAKGQIPTVLSLQQIAQSDAFRTNLGLVEAAGAPAAVMLSVFDDTGKDIKDIPLTVNPFQQLQLNAFLASQGITLTDGRIQVQVTSGTGKVTAYASVVDNRTNDPLLVSGVPLSATLASRYVLPGVADLNNGQANWRSDVRIFNGGSTPQAATLTLYPLDGTTPLTANATVNPGEVKALNGAVQSLFGVTNVGGALHITTPSDSSLIVTGRTYNVGADGGTFGQFVPAVTANDAVGNGGRPLNILQVEDSPRFRTNLGIAEVTGQPATAEITVFLPDSKVTPKIDIPLQPFQFMQFPIIQQLGLGNVYNARVSVSVVGGTGKITAYGSVIDQQTQDPTYMPPQ